MAIGSPGTTRSITKTTRTTPNIVGTASSRRLRRKPRFIADWTLAWSYGRHQQRLYARSIVDRALAAIAPTGGRAHHLVDIAPGLVDARLAVGQRLHDEVVGGHLGLVGPARRDGESRGHVPVGVLLVDI